MNDYWSFEADSTSINNYNTQQQRNETKGNAFAKLLLADHITDIFVAQTRHTCEDMCSHSRSLHKIYKPSNISGNYHTGILCHNLFVSSSRKKLRLFLGIMLSSRVSMTHPTDAGKEINDSFLAVKSWRIRIILEVDFI